MTRVMFWNVQQFSKNKVENPSGKPQMGGGITQAIASGERKELMLRMVQQANPHILAIVEVAGGAGANCTLIGTKGMEGLRTLLTTLQGANMPDWRLVPPLRISQREGVAVFYRQDKLIFSGPMRWPGGAGPATAAVAAAAVYPEPFNAAVGQRAVPAGAAYNENQPERSCAAQTSGWRNYQRNRAAPAFAPRQPYLTTFVEINARSERLRDIVLCSVHGPADGTAAAYLRRLNTVSQLVSKLGQGEVRVLAGDFNVNLLTPQGALATPYQALKGGQGQFTLGLDAASNTGGFPLAAKGYYTTHIRSRRQAQFWEPAGLYPGYGYFGSDVVQNFYAIDNMLVRGAQPTNFTILNPVVGSPFSDWRRPPGYVPPRGTIQVNRRGGLPNPANEPPRPPRLPNPPAPGEIGERNQFRGWRNYGRIRSTSDHLAIVMDI